MLNWSARLVSQMTQKMDYPDSADDREFNPESIDRPVGAPTWKWRCSRPISPIVSI